MSKKNETEELEKKICMRNIWMGYHYNIIDCDSCFGGVAVSYGLSALSCIFSRCTSKYNFLVIYRWWERI